MCVRNRNTGHTFCLDDYVIFLGLPIFMEKIHVMSNTYVTECYNLVEGKMIWKFHCLFGWRKFGEFKELKRKFWKWQENRMGREQRRLYLFYTYNKRMTFANSQCRYMSISCSVPLYLFTQEIFINDLIHSFNK